LPLSDGDWIEVKRRLTHGEQQRLAGAAIGKVSQVGKGDAELGLDLERFGIERLAIWLTDWSFRDSSDKPVKLTRSAIAALDPETVEEIDAALAAHIEALEQEKKAMTGSTSPGVKSP
jgi:hypothetical protein